MRYEPSEVENTMLIAEFMGYEIITYNDGRKIYNGHKQLKTIGERNKLWNGKILEFAGRFVEYVKYPFDEDLNLIFAVIRKIESLGFVICIAGISCKAYRIMQENDPIVSLVCGDPLKKSELIYDTVIGFIKWYNENK